MKKLIALLLAALMVLSLAACGSQTETAADPAAETPEPAAEAAEAAEPAAEPAAEAGAVMSHDEYVAAALDTEVCVETYIQAKQSWWEDKATCYTQAPDGAYFLYNMTCSEEDYAKLVPGTKIRVTGYKSEWSGEVEIVDATFEIVEGDTFVAEAFDAADAFGTDALVDHQNELFALKGVTVEAANDEGAAFMYNWDGSGSQGDDLYFNVSLNGQTYAFTVESYLCDSSTDTYKAVESLNVGDVIDVEGFLYWYDTVQPHITAVTPAA